jgi:hypothetical protein
MWLHRRRVSVHCTVLYVQESGDWPKDDDAFSCSRHVALQSQHHDFRHVGQTLTSFTIRRFFGADAEFIPNVKGIRSDCS